MSSDPDGFLIVPEAAAELRMAKRTLDHHRRKGTGPKFRRHGGRIVYRRGDLLAWSEERAARTEAGRKSSRGSSSGRTGSNGPRHARTRSDKGKRPKTALESQSKHCDWPLRADKAGPIKGPNGGHPTP